MRFTRFATGVCLLFVSTVWSAPIPPAIREGDAALQQKLAKQHEEFVAKAKQGNIDILLLGDSITNRWPPQLWEQYFAPLRAERFGIEGEQVQCLQWRLLNGELDGIHPKVVVLLIGTNNVPRDYSAADIADTVAAIIKTISEKSPGTKILILGILPRNEKPSNIMRDRITLANEGLAKLDNGSSVRFLDLGGKVTTPDGVITRETMPDFLHPSPAAYEALMKEIGPAVKSLAN